MNLMIVDDSIIMRKAISSYLQDLNLTIVANASNGLEAIKLFEEKMPDIVTLDITMPELDGIKCLEKIIKTKPDVKVLIISALNDEATAIKALKLGAKGFVYKPFTKEKLQAAFNDIIG